MFVPWVLSNQTQPKERKAKGKHRPEEPEKHADDSTRAQTQDETQQTFNRFYHMFARGELTTLVREAAEDMSLKIGCRDEGCVGSGIEIVQDGWERSNYYVELRRWCSR